MSQTPQARPFRGDELAAFPLTAQQQHQAALTIADRAADAGECRMLPEMCGLLEERP